MPYQHKCFIYYTHTYIYVVCIHDQCCVSLYCLHAYYCIVFLALSHNFNQISLLKLQIQESIHINKKISQNKKEYKLTGKSRNSILGNALSASRIQADDYCFWNNHSINTYLSTCLYLMIFLRHTRIMNLKIVGHVLARKCRHLLC